MKDSYKYDMIAKYLVDQVLFKINNYQIKSNFIKIKIVFTGDIKYLINHVIKYLNAANQPVNCVKIKYSNVLTKDNEHILIFGIIKEEMGGGGLLLIEDPIYI